MYLILTIRLSPSRIDKLTQIKDYGDLKTETMQFDPQNDYYHIIFLNINYKFYNFANVFH